MGWENDYLISNDPPDDREINSTGEEMEEPKVWGLLDVVGYVPSYGGLPNGRQVQFQDLLPEVQAALTSAQERDMTPAEALTEAKKRWGNDAYVCFEGFGYGDPDNQEIYHVGRASGPIFGNCYDVSGKTFRAAFASADRAAKEKP